MKNLFRFAMENDVEFMRILLPGASAVFSTRQGGVSDRPFNTMNLAFHVGDEQQSVVQNRVKFAEATGMELDNVVCARQVHGTNIKVLSFGDRGRGAYSLEDAIPGTDALITAERDCIPAAFFADCVPVYIADPVKSVVGLAHAGWKGTAKGIAGKTVLRMREQFACILSDCYAFIGPSIGPCCYTIGDEVVSCFDSSPPEDCDSPLIKKQGKWMLDLWTANRNDLLSAGLLPDHIWISRICTQCDGRFFSYRRDGGSTGRMGAFIRPL